MDGDLEEAGAFLVDTTSPWRGLVALTGTVDFPHGFSAFDHFAENFAEREPAVVAQRVVTVDIFTWVVGE